MTNPENIIGLLAGHNLWQSLVAVLVVSLVLYKLGKSSAEERSWTWTATLVGLALLPIATFLPGQGFLSSTLAIDSTQVIPAEIPQAVPSEPAEATVNTSATNISATSDEASGIEIPWLRLALLAWFAGAGISLYLLTRSGINAAKLRKTAFPFVSDGRTAPRGWPENAELAISDEIGGPMVVGILKPLVLVPRQFARDMAPKALNQLLFHELAHLKRLDNVIYMIERVILAVYWWNPMMHFIARRISEERELACDDRAARACGDQTAYASSLLEGARHLMGQAMPVHALGALRRESPLSHRIKRLTKSHLPASVSLFRIGQSLGILVVAIALLGMATPRLTLGDNSAAEAASMHDPDRDREGRTDEEILSDELGHSLVEAAMRGTMGTVQALVRAGANVDYKLYGDGNALIAAVRNGHTDMLEYLIEAGADVNGSVGGDGSALIVAAARGGEGMVQLLLDAGADVNMAVGGDGNPLIMASEHGDLSMVRLLVEAGADVNAYVKGDETPLINASARGSLRVVRYLVEQGADVNMEVEAPVWRQGNREEVIMRSPLSEARRYGHDDIVDYLLDVGARD